MSDILDRLDKALAPVESQTDRKYMSKEIVEKVISLLREDQDDMVLDLFEEAVEKGWNISNIDLREKFYQLLEYYGVIGESEGRKCILETIGKNLVKKYVVVSKKDEILDLIET
jgi:hypothetical protein